MTYSYLCAYCNRSVVATQPWRQEAVRPRLYVAAPVWTIINDSSCKPACTAWYRSQWGQLNCLSVYVCLWHRPPSRRLESETAGLRSLWLASRLKPWIRITHGLGWLMAASHAWLIDANRKISHRKLGCWRHLGLLIFTIFIGTWDRGGVELHDCAKFRQNWSNGFWDITIFWVFRNS